MALGGLGGACLWGRGPAAISASRTTTPGLETWLGVGGPWRTLTRSGAPPGAMGHGGPGCQAGGSSTHTAPGPTFIKTRKSTPDPLPAAGGVAASTGLSPQLTAQGHLWAKANRTEPSLQQVLSDSGHPLQCTPVPCKSTQGFHLASSTPPSLRSRPRASERQVGLHRHPLAKRCAARPVREPSCRSIPAGTSGSPPP